MKILNALFLGLLLSTAAQAEEPHPYTIGGVLPLSGPNATFGVYMRKGMELALSELPEAERGNLRLEFQDDNWKAENAISSYRNLRSTKKIDLVIVAGSAIGLALAPITERDAVPLVAIGASNAKVSTGRKYAFTHWVTPESEGEALVSELKKRKYQRYAYIGLEHEGINALRAGVLGALKAQGLEKNLVIDQSYNVGETDFRTFLAQAKSKEVDVFITCLMPGSLSSFAKQARATMPKTALAGIELFEDENEVKAAEGALTGQWYVNGKGADADFIKRYRAKYSEYPGFGAANAYDLVKLFSAAVKSGVKSSDEMVKYLESVHDYPGASGKFSSTGDHRFYLPAAIKIVTKDGFEEL